MTEPYEFNYKICRRINDPGDAHYLTFSCYRHQPFLTEDCIRERLISALREACAKHVYGLWAYVIMPDHVHLMVKPQRTDYNVSTFLHSVKRSVALFAIKHAKDDDDGIQIGRMTYVSPSGETNLRLWQPGGGYDRNIFSRQELWEKIDYMHANPVRRGLSENAADWKWSSAAQYYNASEGLLKLDLSGLPERE
jgi:putative transposase